MAKKEKLSPEELLEQALVKEEEQPYAVPGNWVWTRLDYLCNYIQRGKGPKYSQLEEIPVISQKCIQWDGFDLSKARFIDPLTVDSYIEDRFIQPMDLLWNSTGTGTIGRITYYPKEPFLKKVVADSHVTVIRTIKDKVSPKFLLYWFSSPYVQDYIDAFSSGTTNQIELNTSTIRMHKVPLPPLPEQQRIVVVIESLFEKLDRAKELAQNALDSFENRKSAIMHKAFTGELTRKWREENECKAWINCVLNDIILEKPRNGYSPSGVSYITKYKNLTLSATTKGMFRSNCFKYVDIDIDDNSYLWLKTGDILIQRSNSLEYVGTCAIYDGQDNEYIYPDLMMKIQTNTSLAITKFVYYILSDMKIKKYYRDNATGTAGNMPKINQKVVMNTPLLLPPLPEQQEIVRILDDLLENEQKAKELCDVIDKIDHMKKSILARAFRGELGTNNPAEESALGLLKEVLKVRA